MNPNTDPAMRYVVIPAFGLAVALGITSCGETVVPSTITSAPVPDAEAPGAAPTISTETAPGDDRGLIDPVKKLRASQITSTFENSTTEIQYGYAENIEDGRGITAGRAGFTSGTSDLLEVIERYTEKQPGNSLERYLPALRAIDSMPEDARNTEGLDGFIETWSQASDTDPLLNQTQDEVVDELYFNPAMQRAEAIGVRSSLGQLIMWDTIIQHGEGDDLDGLPAIVREVSSIAGSATGNEAEWLDVFLRIREQHLVNAADPDTREAWRASVSRVSALRLFLANGNLALDLPFEWTVYGDAFQCDSEGICAP